MSANDRQVGGTHYKDAAHGGEEHWDRIWRAYGAGYFVGCITKYVERYQLKNGVQDLEKARHFLDKLIELESAALSAVPTPEDPTQLRMYESIIKKDLYAMQNAYGASGTGVGLDHVFFNHINPVSSHKLHAEAEESNVTWEGIYGNGESAWKCNNCRVIYRSHNASSHYCFKQPEESMKGYVGQ